jgi:hypothetical protein
MSMTRKREAPTAEQVAEVSGGNVETAKRALLAVRFRDNTDE